MGIFMTQDGWHKADIIAAVRKIAGLSLTKLSVANELHAQACQQALHRPYLKAELVISKAIDVLPQQIWPERYEHDGSRKKSLYSARVTKKNSNAIFKANKSEQ